jgi:ubiquitin-conjugating enzyme E2 D/E
MPAGFVPGIVNAKHIKQELSNLKLPGGCSVKETDVFKWQVTLKGAPGTAYERGEFNLEVDFPHSACNWKEDYPERAPQLRFTEPKKIYHCNVDANGVVHLDILKSKYNKDVGISKILEVVHAMFANPELDGAVCPGVALNYREDRATHDKLAREWACGSNSPQPVGVALNYRREGREQPGVREWACGSNWQHELPSIAPPIVIEAPPIEPYMPDMIDPYAMSMDRIQRDAVARYVGIEYNEAPTLV